MGAFFYSLRIPKIQRQFPGSREAASVRPAELYRHRREKKMYPLMEHDACGIGTIVNIDGRQDRRVVDDALHIVEKLEHRAGKDATGEVGDGVGILTQIPHGFFSKAAKAAGIELRVSGEAGRYPQENMARGCAGCQAGDYGIWRFWAGAMCRCESRFWERRRSTACPASVSASWRGPRMWSGA